VVENDINAAALAEQADGHGREVGSFAFVSVGTGAVVDGCLAAAAELAWDRLTVDLPAATAPVAG
jgi:predicted NBD/HSP70 family sugar kinase